MRRTLLTLMATTTLALAIPAIASAQPWQSISQRGSELFERIDAGVRNRTITNADADRLRADFNALERLESEYGRSAPGLTTNELQDLERRFSDLSMQVRYDANDRNRIDNRYDNRYDQSEYDDRGQWTNFEERRASLFRRIDAGQRNGQLTRAESDRLRRDFDALVQMETRYRSSGGGLSTDERRDLDARYRQLSEQVRDDRRDNDRSRDRDRDHRNIQDVRADLDRRIDVARGAGRLSRNAAKRLRADSLALIRMEQGYRASAPGMTAAEWAQIDRAVYVIEDRLNDGARYGSGFGPGVANGGRYDRYER